MSTTLMMTTNYHYFIIENNITITRTLTLESISTAAVRVLSSSGVAPYNDATLQELKAKHPFMSAPSLRDSHIDHHPLIASQDVVLDRIKSFPRGTSCGRDGLRAQHLMDCLSGAAVAISDELVSSITQVVNLFLEGNCPTVLGGYIASAPLTPLVKPGGGIRPIAVGTIWRRLVSKVSATMIGHSLDGYLDGLQFGVGVPGGGEAILHAVNRLVEDRGDDVGLSMLLVDFQNAFNLVDRTVMLEEVRLRCPAISRWVEFCYSSPARLYYGEHSLWSCQGVQQGDPLGPLLFSLVLHPLICKVLELITEDGPRYGLHLNVDKTELFWPKEDPRSRLEGIFPPNISRPLHGVKLLGGPVSVDADFGSALVMKRVAKTIGLLESSMALRSALERIVTASGPGFGDWQWRIATLPFAFGGLGIYSAGDVLNYAFIASRLQSATLQTKLLRDVGIVVPGSTFDDALCVFNNAMEIDFLSNPSEVAAPKLMKKMADIYFTRVTKDAESSYSLSPRQMALWQSQREDHTSDWLRVVPISGLGQTMNGKTYRSVLCDRLGVPLFSVSKPCSACSRVFAGDIYGDHAVSCAGTIGIKHRHNMVRDTLVDICFRSGISAGKEVDIGLDGGCDKILRPTDMLLYSWDGGMDVCVDLTGSSPLTKTRMTDFAPSRAVTDAAHRELETDVVTLLNRIRKFSMAQDIGARAAILIFNKISFAIAKRVGGQIVSRLPTNSL
ncbi:putative reverse transcriptase domain-containing protein [Tanacetum coccineum]